MEFPNGSGEGGMERRRGERDGVRDRERIPVLESSLSSGFKSIKLKERW